MNPYRGKPFLKTPKNRNWHRSGRVGPFLQLPRKNYGDLDLTVSSLTYIQVCFIFSDCLPTISGAYWASPVTFAPCSSGTSCTFTNNAPAYYLANPNGYFCYNPGDLTFLDSSGNAIYSVNPTGADAATFSCKDGVLYVTYDDDSAGTVKFSGITSMTCA